MNRISYLHRLPGHRQAENTEFMSRLCFKNGKDLPSRADCINHLSQYIFLYEAIEQRIGCLADASPALFEMFCKAPWLHRSSQMKEDVEEMKQALPRAELRHLFADGHILPAMENMVKKIKHADAVTLFACLSVRYLGDVFGGQSLCRYQQDVFSDTPLAAKFYKDVHKEIQNMCEQVKAAPLTEEEEIKFFRVAGDFFQDHVYLLEEMEKERKQTMTVSSCYSKGGRYTLYALSAAGIALSAGALYSQMSFRD